MLKQACLVGLLIFAGIGSTGCRSLTGPRWAIPGTVLDQQQEAVVHDPYASEEIAPPIDVRPRDYAKDFSQPHRDRLFIDSGHSGH